MIGNSTPLPSDAERRPTAVPLSRFEARSAVYESTKEILNTEPDPLRVWLEPWVEEVVIPPGVAFRFVGLGEQPGELQIERQDKRLVLCSWASSRLTVYHGNEVVWNDVGMPVPPVPDGMSTASFVKQIFHARNPPKRAPCWQFWKSWNRR